MMQNKLLIAWNSLQAKQQKSIKILFLLALILFTVIYLVNIYEKISINKRTLVIAKDNFTYVFERAQNFQTFSLAKESLSRFPEKNDFIFSESTRFKLIDFQLGSEEKIPFISFTNDSVTHFSKFLESLMQHPEINISRIKIVPIKSSYQVRVYFSTM
tara:strand:- start:2069 stop:2542 length:474 start_codon:yes stop_codon:yes gene_type:complete